MLGNIFFCIFAVAMRLGRYYRILSMVLVFCSLHVGAAAQRIVRLSVPERMCKGQDDTVGFGFELERNVVVGYGSSTLGHTDRIFLPDGVVCDSNCSYVSPVTFTVFAPGDTISSVEDIDYVRINIEHSYIGDIYMGITCPNGQKASLLNWKTGGSSPCTGSVPYSHRGWNTDYANNSGAVFLGQANDHEGSPLCDSTIAANAPGTGWNYCWSDNTTMGYQYAPDDGLIYRAANVVSVDGNPTVDSSDVANGSHFYHPNQSFSSLVGCPLNGTWSIEVIDAFSQDNGYIFEWDLALDATRIPMDTSFCAVESYFMEGLNISVVDDSTFAIHAPDSLSKDTTCLYRFAVVTSCGDTIDTTATITFVRGLYDSSYVVRCDECFWNGNTYTSNTIISELTHTSSVCDSIHQTFITVHPSKTTYVTKHAVENDLPHFFHGQSFSEPVQDSLLHDTTAFGCDSNIFFTLVVAFNRYDTVDTAICAIDTPFVWNGRAFAATTSCTDVLAAANGADSVVTLNLTVYASSNTVVNGEICNGIDFLFDGNAYDETGTYELHYSDRHGCDSLITLVVDSFHIDLRADLQASPLIVTPAHPDVHLYDHSAYSTSRLWYVDGATFAEKNIVYPFPSDADSLPVVLVAYSPEGCADTASTVILLDRSSLFVPNVFTPDLTENNRWSPALLDIETLEVWIYDRQGRLVAYLDGTGDSWDGTHDGTPCPQGSYVYYLKYHSSKQPYRAQTLTGTILLLR